MIFKKLPEKKITSLLLIAIILLLAGFIFYPKPITRNPDWNVVIISVDALRPDHTSVYGYQKDTTPNLNKLAQSAFVFNNFRTVVPMTYPSFASLMTGKNPLTTGIVRNRGYLISDNNKTLSTYLSDSGYRTAAFLTGALRPDLTGFNQNIDKVDYQPFKTYSFVNSKEVYAQSDRQSYEEFVTSANNWVNSNKNSQFFLWLHLMDPHAPYQPTDDLKCQFNTEFCPYILSKTDEELEQERSTLQQCQTLPIPEEKVKLFETLYDGGVAYSDKLAGMVIDNLTKNNLDKNTVVIIFSDHGEGFDHNYYFNHREVLYDSALKTVLIIKSPNNSTRHNISEPIQNSQVLTSLLDLLNIKYNKSLLDNNNFYPLISNNPLGFLQINSHKSKYSYFNNSNLTKFAVFDGKYKYIYSLPESCLLNNQKDELYDLSKDPAEKNNLYLEKKEISERLKNNLMEYLSKHNLPPKLKKNIQPIPQTENKYNVSEDSTVIPY